MLYDFRRHFSLEQRINANFDVSCMQEMSRIGSKSIVYSGYNFYLTSLNERKIAIRTSFNIVIENVNNSQNDGWQPT